MLIFIAISLLTGTETNIPWIEMIPLMSFNLLPTIGYASSQENITQLIFFYIPRLRRIIDVQRQVSYLYT